MSPSQVKPMENVLHKGQNDQFSDSIHLFETIPLLNFSNIHFINSFFYVEIIFGTD